MTTIVVEHRDRFARFGAGYVAAVLDAERRRMVVVDGTEVDDGPPRQTRRRAHRQAYFGSGKPTG